MNTKKTKSRCRLKSARGGARDAVEMSGGLRGIASCEWADTDTVIGVEGVLGRKLR